MNYISYNFVIQSDTLSIQMVSEILIAELGLVGFESFTEKEDGIIAYIQKKDWNDSILDGIRIINSQEVVFDYSMEEVKQVNWNSEWEKNFNPIQVDNRVSIRASFHANPNLEYDIVIEPKMSFGTGHHETTHLMIQHLLDMDLKGKSVLDMGCGTGILAIFAEMKGAYKLDAIDIDPWCVENSNENLVKNQREKISVYLGDSDLLNDKKYDLIIANINRNILLQDMPKYTSSLNKNGTLLLSGFYKKDIVIIDEEARRNQLILVKTLERNNWVALKYVN